MFSSKSYLETNVVLLKKRMFRDFLVQISKWLSICRLSISIMLQYFQTKGDMEC